MKRIILSLMVIAAMASCTPGSDDFNVVEENNNENAVTPPSVYKPVAPGEIKYNVNYLHEVFIEGEDIMYERGFKPYSDGTILYYEREHRLNGDKWVLWAQSSQTGEYIRMTTATTWHIEFDWGENPLNVPEKGDMFEDYTWAIGGRSVRYYRDPETVFDSNKTHGSPIYDKIQYTIKDVKDLAWIRDDYQLF